MAAHADRIHNKFRRPCNIRYNVLPRSEGVHKERGGGGEEVIHLFTLAMKTQLTASELAAMTYAYPTFSSDLKFLV